MKNIVFSPVRSGNHFILRSLSKSLQIPYAVFLEPDHLEKQIVNHEKYIVSIHKEKDLNLMSNLGDDVKYLTIYRNPIDHALSILRYYRIKIDPNSKEFIDWLKEDFYLDQRNIIKSCSDLFTINYDSLCSSNLFHINEIKNFFNIKDLILENILETKKEHGNGIAQIGLSGRWRDIISEETWIKIVDSIDEPLNDFWNFPNKELESKNGTNVFFYDYESGYREKV